MEMTGVNEAAQLINVSINGVSTALRLSGSFINWSMHEIADLARIITALVRKKSEDLKPGEWNWGDLIRKCGKEEIELTTFDVDLSIKEEITEHLKEMKIPFSILPDINVEDGKFQISLPKSYDEAIIAFGSRFNTPGNPFTGEKGHIAVARTTLEGYMKTADPEKIREFLREVMEDPEMEQAMQFQKDKEAVASPDVARYFTDLHQDAEVLVVNDAGEGYDTPSVRSSAMDTLKAEEIDFLILPRDKDGRSCFLVDTKRREDISKTFPQERIVFICLQEESG